MTHTREEIVFLADQLIRIKGYDAFSYRNIGAVLAIRNAGIHHYFPLKADLGHEVIAGELGRVAAWEQEGAGNSGTQQLRKVVESFYRLSRQGQMCLTGAFVPDYHNLPADLQSTVREMTGTILDHLEACLERGRKEGGLHFEGTAADRALLVCSALLSSVLLSRVMGMEVFDRMTGQWLRDLGVEWTMADLAEDPENGNGVSGKTDPGKH